MSKKPSRSSTSRAADPPARGSSASRARRNLVAALAAVALVLLVVLLASRSDRDRDARGRRSDEETIAQGDEARGDRSSRAREGTPRSRPALSDEEQDALRRAGGDDRRGPPTPTGPDAPRVDSVRTLREGAAEYRRRARYPQSSEPLPPDRPDPVRADREPTRHEEIGHRGGPTLVAWNERTYFAPPDPVVLQATLLENGEPTQRPGTVITATVLEQDPETEQVREVGTTAYTDDGQSGDPIAGDGVYTASFQVPEDRVADPGASMIVRIVAQVPGEEHTHTAIDGFLYSNPRARLTGRWRDELREGSLVVRAEIQVARAGRQHLQATLSSADGTLIGWAQNAGHFEPGTHWIELTYYGLMFHDAGVAGPYVVATATLSTTGVMPHALGPLLTDVHTTRAYALSDFTDESFGEPGMLEAARRMDEEAVRVEARSEIEGDPGDGQGDGAGRGDDDTR